MDNIPAYYILSMASPFCSTELMLQNRMGLARKTKIESGLSVYIFICP